METYWWCQGHNEVIVLGGIPDTIRSPLHRCRGYSPSLADLCVAWGLAYGRAANSHLALVMQAKCECSAAESWRRSADHEAKFLGIEDMIHPLRKVSSSMASPVLCTHGYQQVLDIKLHKEMRSNKTMAISLVTTLPKQTPRHLQF